MATATSVLSQSFDGIFYRVQTTSFDARFIISADADPERVENVDVEVRLTDGSRWSATMFTVAEVQRLMARWSQTGECGGGAYFWCRDGVIVGDPGVRAMTAVLIGLHDDDDGLTAVLQRLDEE
ncbi:hypothetical protein ACFVMC_13485 [Nocardia sp. NPDC127579]|uniref:hypothetical protein n=1 Tax=Nocardia sp. NPDC127579 TaxID=3345402 RepID=UPI0036275108